MRAVIAAGAASLLISGCGGSSGNGSGAAGKGSSGGGSCSTMITGTYLFHWTYVSGGPTCQASTPADSTQVVDQDAGISMGVSDAGACVGTQSGCSYSAMCSSTAGDAGSFQITETATIGSDGSITGTAMISYALSLGGTAVSASCTYDLTATKQ